jgi:hypothetical protein
MSSGIGSSINSEYKNTGRATGSIIKFIILLILIFCTHLLYNLADFTKQPYTLDLENGQIQGLEFFSAIIELHLAYLS